MRHAIDPSPKRTRTIESVEAAPQRDVNFLQEVTALVIISLICTSEPTQGRAEMIGGLLV